LQSQSPPCKFTWSIFYIQRNSGEHSRASQSRSEVNRLEARNRQKATDGKFQGFTCDPNRLSGQSCPSSKTHAAIEAGRVLIEIIPSFDCSGARSTGKMVRAIQSPGKVIYRTDRWNAETPDRSGSNGLLAFSYDLPKIRFVQLESRQRKRVLRRSSKQLGRA